MGRGKNIQALTTPIRLPRVAEQAGVIFEPAGENELDRFYRQRQGWARTQKNGNWQAYLTFLLQQGEAERGLAVCNALISQSLLRPEIVYFILRASVRHSLIASAPTASAAARHRTLAELDRQLVIRRGVSPCEVGVRTAKVLREAGLRQIADTVVEETLSLGPANHSLMVSYANHCFTMGDLAMAERTLRVAAGTQPDAQGRDSEWDLLGQVAMAQGQAAAAADHFDRCSPATVHSCPGLAARRAHAQALAGQSTRARRWLIQRLEAPAYVDVETPRGPLDLLCIADALEDLSLVRWVQQVDEQRSGAPTADFLQALAATYLVLGEDCQAATQLERSLALQPADRDVAVLCVRLLLSQGEASRADVILAHRRPGWDQDLVTLEQTLAALRTLDQPARALPVAQRLARLQPQRLFWQVSCAQLLNQLQRPAAALQHWDCAVRLRPGHRPTLWALARASLAAETRLDLGDRALSVLIALDPQETDAAMYLGHLRRLRCRGQAASAVAAYQIAAGRAPNSPQPWLGQAAAHLEEMDLLMARRSLPEEMLARQVQQRAQVQVARAVFAPKGGLGNEHDGTDDASVLAFGGALEGMPGTVLGSLVSGTSGRSPGHLLEDVLEAGPGLVVGTRAEVAQLVALQEAVHALAGLVAEMRLLGQQAGQGAAEIGDLEAVAAPAAPVLSATAAADEALLSFTWAGRSLKGRLLGTNYDDYPVLDADETLYWVPWSTDLRAAWDTKAQDPLHAVPQSQRHQPSPALAAALRAALNRQGSVGKSALELADGIATVVEGAHVGECFLVGGQPRDLVRQAACPDSGLTPELSDVDILMLVPPARILTGGMQTVGLVRGSHAVGGVSSPFSTMFRGNVTFDAPTGDGRPSIDIASACVAHALSDRQQVQGACGPVFPVVFGYDLAAGGAGRGLTADALAYCPQRNLLIELVPGALEDAKHWRLRLIEPDKPLPPTLLMRACRAVARGMQADAATCQALSRGLEALVQDPDRFIRTLYHALPPSLRQASELDTWLIQMTDQLRQLRCAHVFKQNIDRARTGLLGLLQRYRQTTSEDG